jgi:hypothetical protein
MAYRAKELTLENVNRVFLMIQKDLYGVKRVTLPSGELITAVDLSPITGSLDQILARVSVLESSDILIKSDLATKADKNNSVNAYPIGDNPVLAGTDMIMGNGDQNTLYEAIKAAQSIFNIVGAADTYAGLPSPSTVPAGGVYVVLQDETHDNLQTLYRRTSEEQWLFTGVFAINLSAYYTKGEANALLDDNSTKDRAYSDTQIAAEAQARDTAINTAHRTISNETANAISLSAQSVTDSLTNTIEFSLSNYVLKTRTINGKSLYTDIVIDTTNIQYNGQSLFNYLGTLSGSLSYKGSVETEEDLPDPERLHDGLIYTVLATMALMVTSEGTWQYFGKIGINLDDYYTKEETYSRGEIDANIATAKSDVESDLNAAVGQLNANIAAAQSNAVSMANGYTDNRLDNDVIPSLETDSTNKANAVKEYADNNKVAKTFQFPFMNDITFSQGESSVNANLTRYYLDTTGAPKEISLPMASGAVAGFMPASDHSAIGDLQERVASLEASGVYIGQSFSSYAELMGTPISPAWTVNDFTFVQDDESHGDHATEYILVETNGVLGWEFARYDDIDIPEFSASTMGIIKPSSEDGFIDGTADHTGKVSGWASLKNRVSDAEDTIGSLSTRFTTEVPVTAAIADNAVTLIQNAKVIANSANLTNTTHVSNAISAHAAVKGTYGLGHVLLASLPGAINIDSSGAIYHLDTDGNKHLPSGGSVGQVPCKTSSGYGWTSFPTPVTPEPMEVINANTALTIYIFSGKKIVFFKPSYDSVDKIVRIGNPGISRLFFVSLYNDSALCLSIPSGSSTDFHLTYYPLVVFLAS